MHDDAPMRLIAEGLAASRGGERIFSEVDFVLAQGEALTVTGPNGSGKSTLLRVVAGLLAPAAGSVRLEGGPAGGIGAAAHYFGHANAMKAAMSVAENLAFWQGFLGEPDLSAADALDAFGLADLSHLPYTDLSAGQKRRAAAARLLVSRRPVWLLDEPTASLDAASEAVFVGLMRRHVAAGGILMAATHLPLGLEGARQLRMSGRSRLAPAEADGQGFRDASC